MAQTYVEKNANSDLTTYNDGSAGTVNVRKVLDIVAGGAKTLQSSLAINSTNKEIFITIASLPNSLVWNGGSYAVNVNVNQAATRGSFISEVILARISANGTITRATKSSGAISISLSSLGVKTQTVVWNDGTQNPAGSLQTDRLVVIWRTTNPSGTNSDVYKYEVEVSTNSDTVVETVVASGSLSETLTLSDSIRLSIKNGISITLSLNDTLRLISALRISDSITLQNTLRVLVSP